MNKIVDEYYCNICNKKYSNYNSLWTHNKKFHTIKKLNDTILDIKNTKNDTICNTKDDTKYNCSFCNRIFNFRQNKYQHEKRCKHKKKKEDENKIVLLDKEIELTKLKIKLQNGKKLSNKSFQSMNKMLMEKAYQNTINSNNNNNNSNNTVNIQNNYKIIGFGKEEIVEALSLKEKKMILQERLCCIEKCIEISNVDNHNEFKNIVITNLKDNYAYKFDDTKGYFVVCSKTDVLNELISNRVVVIEEIYDELILTNKIGEYTKDKIKEFLVKINQEDKPFTDENEEVKYPNYKDYKINKIKILLYNNQNKITKDIATLLTEDQIEIV